MKNHDSETIFKYFAKSNNIAVWYELDKIVSRCNESIKEVVIEKFR